METKIKELCWASVWNPELESWGPAHFFVFLCLSSCLFCCCCSHFLGFGKYNQDVVALAPTSAAQVYWFKFQQTLTVFLFSNSKPRKRNLLYLYVYIQCLLGSVSDLLEVERTRFLRIYENWIKTIVISSTTLHMYIHTLSTYVYTQCTMSIHKK